MRPLREQHDDIDLIAVAERLDGGAAGVAGGRDHDGAALAARGQHVVHQPRQKLHRHVLEGQRRAVEQFERKGIHAELRQRRHRGMAEVAVGLARHAGEVGFGDGIAGERPDHLDGDFGIGPAGEAEDGLVVEPRPGFRHIEAAVAGEAREHHVGKAERRGLAPGRDVAQSTAFLAPARTPRADRKSIDFPGCSLRTVDRRRPRIRVTVIEERRFSQGTRGARFTGVTKTGVHQTCRF